LFLEAFRKSGNLSASARRAKATRQGVYERLERDEGFKAAFDDAKRDANESLETEARRRAVTGVLEPVFYQGEECGRIRKYSDTLLIVLMKGNMPDKYRERVTNEHTGEGGGPIEYKHSGHVDLTGLTPEELMRLYNEEVNTPS